MKRMLIFMLLLACIGFTGCKKDKTPEKEIFSETVTRTETISEMISETETENFSETETETETKISDSGKTITTTETTGTEIGTITTETETTTEISLNAENILQAAELDEEERKAIEAVQQTEPPIYYKNPTQNFEEDSYSNLHIEGYGFSLFNSSAGNIYQNFYETTNLSGADLLFMKNAVESFSGSAFNSEQVKSSTGQTIEESEKLIYQNELIYAEMDKFGNFYIQNQTLQNNSLWTPEENQGISLIAKQGYFYSDDYLLTFGNQTVEFQEVDEFLKNDIRRLNESELFPESYEMMESPEKIEEIELKDGRKGYLFTFSVGTRISHYLIDNRKRSRYENENRAVNGQYVQMLMLSSDSVDYCYFPPMLTRKFDYQQMLPKDYCSLAEACQIISEHLPSEQVFDVEDIQLGFGTIFFYDENHQFQGIACVPMWYMDLLSPDGGRIFANVDVNTKELYFGYE